MEKKLLPYILNVIVKNEAMLQNNIIDNRMSLRLSF